MATARKLLIDESVSGIYHCFSRCVRQAYLLAPEKQSRMLRNERPAGHQDSERPSSSQLDAGEFKTTIRVDDHRREWIMERLTKLSRIFAIDCISVAVMSNHMHLLLRNLPEAVREWTDAEVAYRWFTLHPAQAPKGFLGRRAGIQLDEEGRQDLIGCKESIAEWRKRLSSISWYMKELKEPIARISNAEDRVTGAFWEERFKSYRIRDNLGLLVCATYIDFNPVTASICESPLASPFTSIELRVNQMERAGNSEIRALWKKCAEKPEVHGYEEPDEDLEAFIEQFDDAEFLPALPAHRAAFGIADSWFPPGYFDKVNAASSAQETEPSEFDLSDLQPPAPPPLDALPMISTRAYVRRLRSLTKFRREAREETIAKDIQEVRGQTCDETLRKMKEEATALATRMLDELHEHLLAQHELTQTGQPPPCDRELRRREQRPQTYDMIKQIATRFELNCIPLDSRTLQLLPAGIKLWEPQNASKFGM